MASSDPEEIEKQFNLASKYSLPPCTWIPPEWEEGQAEPPKLVDTISKPVKFEEFEFTEINGTEAFPGKCKPEKPKDKPHGFDKWVHPDSDFDHDHHDALDAKAIKEIGDKVGRGSDTFKKLNRVVGGGTLGMQRLACVFEWILYQTSELLKEMNIGLGSGIKEIKAKRSTYMNARDNYIALLQDLDDHKVRGKEIKPGEPGKSGYGKALKWVNVFPVIFNGKIIGMKTVCEWNPHSSSNGVPIEHSPPPPPPDFV